MTGGASPGLKFPSRRPGGARRGREGDSWGAQDEGAGRCVGGGGDGGEGCDPVAAVSGVECELARCHELAEGRRGDRDRLRRTQLAPCAPSQLQRGRSRGPALPPVGRCSSARVKL